MGEAGVDLPDPLSTPPLGQAPSTDELLAQMAGEEIDRLLADAESAPPKPITAEPPPAIAQAKTEDEQNPAISKELDVLFNELNAAAPAEGEPPSVQVAQTADPAPAPSAPEPPPKPDEESQLQQELDNLFNELTAPEPPPPAEAAPGPEGVKVSQLAAASVDAPLPGPLPELGVDPEQQTGSAELHALAEPIPDPTPSAPQAPQPPRERVPFLIRILEILNAPMALFPDSARDALGKVAILTLINAILVLAYVAFFRRH